MIVLNHPQGSEDWLRARVGAATASRFTEARQRVGLLTEQQATFVKAIKDGHHEAAAVAMAGYKKRPTAQGVERALAGLPVDEPGADAIDYSWLIAIETVHGEPLDETFVTYAMRRGRELEPIARQHYELRTGALVEEASLILTDDRRFGYSTDGLVDDDGLIEIKCPMSPKKLGMVWAQPQDAAAEYLNQIEGGLWITRRKWCDLVIYCPWLASVGKDLFVQRIYRNEERIEALEQDLIGFMRLVDANLAVLRSPTTMTGRPKDRALDAKPAEPTSAPIASSDVPAKPQPAAELPDSIFK